MNWYFDAPLELLQGFMNNYKKCLDDIMDYQIVKFGSIDEARCNMGIRYGNPASSKMKAAELESCKYSGVRVGITSAMMWDFYKNDKTDLEKLCFLCYHAFRTIGSRKRCELSKVVGVRKTTIDFLFSRMAGQPKKVGLHDMGELAEYLDTAGKRRYWWKKISEETMLRYPNLHIYTARKLRGVLFMFSDYRKEAYKKMAEYHAKTNKAYKLHQIEEEKKSAQQEAGLI